jgi:hypothetical protein
VVRTSFFFACSAAALILAPAMAQNDAPSAPAASTATPAPAEPPAGPQLTDALAEAGNTWTIRIDPTVWWVSPAGDLTLPSSGATAGSSVDLSRLNLDTPEFTPAGSVAINAGDFRFSFFGAGYSRDAETVADGAFQIGDASFAAGDAIDTSFEFNLFDLTAGYRFYSYDWRKCSQDQEKCIDIVLDLYALGGGRLYDMNIGVNPVGGSGNDTEQFFGDIVAGARAELTILHDFNINVQLTGGGMGDSDRSSFSWDIQVSGEWRPWENVGVQFGWRQVAFSLEDGDGPGKFDFDGSLAGVFAGVVVRF